MPRSTVCLVIGLVLSIGGGCVAALVSAVADDETTPPRAKQENRTQEKDSAAPRRLDPAAWGSDHVGKAFPTYVTGDECLFCHRTIGPTWPENRHQLTVRPVSADDPAIAALRKQPSGEELAAEAKFVMGSERVTRFLRRSAKYGKLEMLSAYYVPHHGDGSEGDTPANRAAGEVKNGDSPRWDAEKFGDHCAGCHTTAVSARTRAFAALSLDCFTCHGDVDLRHTDDVSLVLLSSKNREPREILSICGQCHLRSGKSESSRLPYPNTFVAGDNLFRDFRIDLSDAAIEALPAAERHIFLCVREVVVSGKSDTTCLTCHSIHGQTTERHKELEPAAICNSCHVAGSDNSQLVDELKATDRLRAHSHVCEY